jgi:hypothetical protein
MSSNTEGGIAPLFATSKRSSPENTSRPFSSLPLCWASKARLSSGTGATLGDRHEVTRRIEPRAFRGYQVDEESGAAEARNPLPILLIKKALPRTREPAWRSTAAFSQVQGLVVSQLHFAIAHQCHMSSNAKGWLLIEAIPRALKG